MNIFLSFNKLETLLLTYLLLINILSFALFAIDKIKAKRKKWRISEKILLSISIIGGAIGSLIAMVVFKHKLSKKIFYIGVPILIILNKIAIIWSFSMEIGRAHV